jgi:hypothetical protein
MDSLVPVNTLLAVRSVVLLLAVETTLAAGVTVALTGNGLPPESSSPP